MVDETNYFKAIRNGDYNSIPKALYSLFILAVTNQDEVALTVWRTERPTGIEEAINLYGLKGLKVEIVVNKKDPGSWLNHRYKIMMDVPAFLSNLQTFYQMSAESLQLHCAITKKLRNDRKDPKEPKENDIIIFYQKIGDKKRKLS